VQRVTVTSPRVTAPARSSVPATMRSGMISYSTPCSSFHALDRHGVAADPGNLGAHRARKFARSVTSGSIATLCRRRRPFGHDAREKRVLVAPTLGMRKSMLAPCKRLCLLSAIR